MTFCVILAGTDTPSRLALMDRPELNGLITPNVQRIDPSLGNLVDSNNPRRFNPVQIFDFEVAYRTPDFLPQEDRRKGIIFLADATKHEPLPERLQFELVRGFISDFSPILVLLQTDPNYSRNRTMAQVCQTLNLYSMEGANDPLWHIQSFCGRNEAPALTEAIISFSTMLSYVLPPLVGEVPVINDVVNGGGTGVPVVEEGG